MEETIHRVLAGDARRNALDFVAHLKGMALEFERGKGYWADQLYWMIRHQGEYVCFVLINDSDEQTLPWIVWSDDSESNCFEDFPLDQALREIAWKHVDLCGNCGGCKAPGGRRKILFGKAMEGVCRTALRFDNPGQEALAFMKKMVDIRKAHIDGSSRQGTDHAQ